MKSRIKSFYKRFVDVMKMGEMRILPGQLAYFLVLSIIPLLIIFTFVASKITASTDLSKTLYQVLPSFIVDIVLPALETSNISTNFLVLFIIAFFVASNGPYSIINTADMLYGIKNGKVVRSRIKSIIMTCIILIALLFLLVVPIFGNIIIDFFSNVFNEGHQIAVFAQLYKYLKIPVTFLFIFLNIKIIYTMAPNMAIKSRETTYGALFASIGWIIATQIYYLYITKVADYSLLYGSFSNILVLFIWIYVLSYIFVAGIALNNKKYKDIKEKGSI